jgi:hypothetical protein
MKSGPNSTKARPKKIASKPDKMAMPTRMNPISVSLAVGACGAGDGNGKARRNVPARLGSRLARRRRGVAAGRLVTRVTTC